MTRGDRATFERLRDGAELYGGDIAAWPDAERRFAERAVAEDPAARRVLSEALAEFAALDARVDDALADALRGAPTPSDALIGAVLAAAPRAARLEPASGGRAGALDGVLGSIVTALGGWAPARIAFGGVGAAATLGLLIGVAAPSPEPAERRGASDATGRLVEIAFALDEIDVDRPTRSFWERPSDAAL